MSKKTLKLTLAGALVACAVGAFAIGLARPTTPQGFTSEIIVGPAAMDEIDTLD